MSHQCLMEVIHHLALLQPQGLHHRQDPLRKAATRLTVIAKGVLPPQHTRCEPTTHRSRFTDSTSFSFCRLAPPAHRSDGWRRQMLFATLGRSFAPVPS